MKPLQKRVVVAQSVFYTYEVIAYAFEMHVNNLGSMAYFNLGN